MSVCPLTKQACTDTCAWYRGKTEAKCAAITALAGVAVRGREVSDRLAAINNELHQVAEALELAALNENAAKQPKAVHEITDQELENYIRALNPLEVANQYTRAMYDQFTAWAAANGLKPCTSAKFTRRTCAVHPFTTKSNKYVPIRRVK